MTLRDGCGRHQDRISRAQGSRLTQRGAKPGETGIEACEVRIAPLIDETRGWVHPILDPSTSSPGRDVRDEVESREMWESTDCPYAYHPDSMACASCCVPTLPT